MVKKGFPTGFSFLPALAMALMALLFIRFIAPVVFDTGNSNAAFALSVIRVGLDHYAVDHEGSFPRTDAVTGDPDTDALLRGGYLQTYPPNPCRKGALMKPRRDFAPGDFRYTRSEGRHYFFTLEAFGRDPRGGPEKDGVVATQSRQ